MAKIKFTRKELDRMIEEILEPEKSSPDGREMLDKWLKSKKGQGKEIGR